ncbi:hypothetical protein MCOR25_004261 [Pyricularia grisea]|uniref:DUF7580 domain-containing protein n=1 Tax=Pyricularia grisea TaxID=148305 RepID=A0A6P8B3L9_PYRGI|nr:hypothetical protein PgNI_05860 [Pyricularia grisea]KAI6370087.1 hypothetical protein MCOR25_004261 [Pyricularia grisea]TLD09897.1 hypothetical protein PgNI_05860 [Pyricularia grisea]
MSGIEIAGLALGVLPIVLKSIDAYRDGIRRISTTIRKRKYVEKLARALLLQQQILDEVVKSVLLASGCEDVCALDEDPLAYFDRDDVREQVEEFLGPKNNMNLVGLLQSNNMTIGKVARQIAGLIPSAAGTTDNLLAIIDANQTKTNLIDELAPRIKLLCGITEMKTAIEDIDAGTSAIDRFSRLVLSNRQTVQANTSRKAAKLVKSLGRVRTMASGLYVALSEGFSGHCHDRHETRLYLDDRVDGAKGVAAREGRRIEDANRPLLTFDIVLATQNRQGRRQSYETIVQVFGDEEDGISVGRTDATAVTATSQANLQPPGATEPRLRFTTETSTTRSPSPSHFRMKVTPIASSLCHVITEAQCSRRRLSFAMVGSQSIGTLNESPEVIYTGDESGTINAVSLAEVLQTPGVPLSWKLRMLLALRLSSCLLQLTQTRWLEQGWSKEVVLFPATIAAAKPVSPTHETTASVDLTRPFVACAFGSDSGDAGKGPMSSTVEPKTALLELGILLLEIWHKTTIEARFGLKDGKPGAASSYYERMARAVEWLDDTEEPLPDLYDKAVAHCLRVNIGGDTRFVEWEDNKLWGVVCENIIEPLATICRQWTA